MGPVEPVPGTFEAMYMATWESDRAVVQIPCDGKEVSADVAGLATNGDFVELDESLVNAGDERPDIW